MIWSGIAGSFICWLRFSYKSNTNEAETGEIPFSALWTAGGKSNGTTRFLFRDLSFTNLISPYWLNCSRVFLCLKSQREGNDMDGWGHQDFMGEFTAFQIDSVFYLAVLANGEGTNWRLQKFWEKRPWKEGQSRSPSSISCLPWWKWAHLPGARAPQAAALILDLGLAMNQLIHRTRGFRLHGIVPLLD